LMKKKHFLRLNMTINYRFYLKKLNNWKEKPKIIRKIKSKTKWHFLNIIFNK